MHCTYPSQGDVSQGHLCAIEVEEVHELYCFTFFQSTVIDSSWLVVEFDVHWKNFSMLYNTRIVQREVASNNYEVPTEINFVLWRWRGS